MLLLHIHGLPCAPLFLLVCLVLPLPLLYLCNRFVDRSPCLAFHPFPAEAAVDRQIIKISISFNAGQGSLLFLAEQGLFQFGLAVGVCDRLQGPGEDAGRLKVTIRGFVRREIELVQQRHQVLDFRRAEMGGHRRIVASHPFAQRGHNP